MENVIGIMCDENYNKLEEQLGIRHTINSMNFMELKKGNCIEVDGNEVHVKFFDYHFGRDFFKIRKVEKENGNGITIELEHTSKADNYLFTDMPTEG